MSVKLSLSGVSYLVNEFKSKILNNFITQVTVVNNSDIYFSFSFYNQEKLLISLNHSSPFISLVSGEYKSKTTLGNLNDNLRKYVKNSYVINIEQVNNDRVMKFTLVKNNEFFEKEKYFLVVELIPTINNLILLDEKENIIFAKHYVDLSASRPILKGMKYLPIEKNDNLVNKDFDYQKYQQDVYYYMNEIDDKSQKEKALPLYNHLKGKIKSLNRKIKVLENEKEAASKNLIYKEYGDYLLTYKYDEESLNSYINQIKEQYDSDLSVEENAHKFYEKYKKNKRTIDNDIREINKAKEEVEELNHIIEIFSYYSEEEIEELTKKYLPHKVEKKDKNKVIDSRLPYYVDYLGERIGFGKNKEQNNYLTFKKANSSDIYFHVANTHGAHVVIFNSDPKKEVIEAASHIALILSNLEMGDVYIADIKDVKKGNSLGEALLSKYQTITIHKVDEKYKKLIKEQRRFTK